MKYVLLITLFFSSTFVYSLEGTKSGSVPSTVTENKASLTVYKTPNCGCCGDWVNHIQESGFKAQIVNKSSLAGLKSSLGIPENARSCHTATHQQGFIFEGHIPAKYIRQFLSAPPGGAKGLIVPAMPVGSPGMEYKDKFNPYKIFLLGTDGSLEEFAFVESYDSQF